MTSVNMFKVLYYIFKILYIYIYPFLPSGHRCVSDYCKKAAHVKISLLCLKFDTHVLIYFAFHKKQY